MHPPLPQNSDPHPIDLGALQQEIIAELRAAEVRVAELRGQLQLLTRLVEQAQRPVMSGEPVNGAERAE